MPRPIPSPPAQLDLTQVLHALADPARLKIVKQLAHCTEPIACGSFDAAVTKSTLSHHFRVLREAGVIQTSRAEANRMVNVLRADELDEAFPGLLNAVLAAVA